MKEDKSHVGLGEEFFAATFYQGRRFIKQFATPYEHQKEEIKREKQWQRAGTRQRRTELIVKLIFGFKNDEH